MWGPLFKAVPASANLPLMSRSILPLTLNQLQEIFFYCLGLHMSHNIEKDNIVSIICNDRFMLETWPVDWLKDRAERSFLLFGHLVDI